MEVPLFDFNPQTFGTVERLEPNQSGKRLERSKAVERFERLERAAVSSLAGTFG
jgi:hypothetical protein